MLVTSKSIFRNHLVLELEDVRTEICVQFIVKLSVDGHYGNYLQNNVPIRDEQVHHCLYPTTVMYLVLS